MARAAEAIRCAYLRFHDGFGALTRRGRDRFETRDFSGALADAAERLDLTGRAVGEAVAEVRAHLGPSVDEPSAWSAMKERYSAAIFDRPDLELAETFFNSVTRRIFRTVGVNPEIEYVSIYEPLGHDGGEELYATFESARDTRTLVAEILSAHPFACGWQDLARDAELVAQEIDAHVATLPDTPVVARAEVVREVLYRNKGAYLVGRLQLAWRLREGEAICHIPLVLGLLNEEGGVTVDAVALTESAASVVFSFTRSYFRVDVPHPRHLVAFLKSIMPLKRVAELYISIGYHKHGKTELYRDLLRHLTLSTDRFELAPGEKGMVLAVFTLPSYDFVFKVIRDSFPPPKTTTRELVMSKYNLIFRRDRAGRLVDAQEFEHLTFEKARFAEDLLAELLSECSRTVAVEGDKVVIRHLYAERRMTPLNLFIHQAPPEEAREAIVDYGEALRELAASNIFPGDLLLKNFGVTRHGRVVFYDYDEVCLLTDCCFRDLPEPSDDDDMGAEPSFYVGENDVFPEEFLTFVGMPRSLKGVFLEHHEDLTRPGFWRHTQERIRQGEIFDLYPYAQSRRLRKKRG